MKQQKHFTLLLCLLLCCIAKCYGQALTVSEGVLNTDYTYENNVITVKTSTALTVSGTTTTDRIAIDGSVTANLTIEGIDIQINNNPPISVTANSTLNLTLSGNNKLKTNWSRSGILIPKDATLTIKATSLSDKLETEGGTGIGGYWNNQNAGTITIDNGTIMAIGTYGAGIGGALIGGHGGNVTINGGYVYAKGRNDSADIGGGGRADDGNSSGGNGGSLTVTGGVVVAEHIGHGDKGRFDPFGTTLTINNNSGSTPIIISKTIEVNGVSSPNKSGSYLLTENGAGSVVGNVTLTSKVTIPKGTTVTVGSNSSLTIAGGATLTVEGEIKIDGGTLTNNGTIDNAGTITGTVGGNGKVRKPFGKVAIGTFDDQAYTGSDLTPDISITDGDDTLEKDKDYTLSYENNVNAGTAKVTITPKGDNYYGDAVKKTFSITKKEVTVTLQSEVSKVYDGTTAIDNVSLSLTDVIAGDQSEVSLNSTGRTFTFNSSDVADGISINISQSLALEGSKANNYTLKAPDLKGKITPATLTVTPNANQFHYQDETSIYPTYTYSGQINGETPAFEGQLKWGDESDNDKIKKNNLRLIDNETGKFKASNYTLTVVETQSFTPIAENIADKEATLEASEGSQPVEGWYTADVTIKAPDDFKIRQTGVTPLRNAADWTETSFTFSQEGKHTVSYELKRDGRDNPLDGKSLEVSLDKTAPTIGQPQKGADGKSFTLELADAYSGIATIAYSLNNAGEVSHTDFTKGSKSYTLTLASLEYGTQSISITVTDVAGHTTTETRSIDLSKPEDPNPPVVDPEPEPKPEPEPPVIDPTPVYYTVTLPSVEGATTNPEAGEYEVEAWSSFRFYLLLDDDYNQSAPVVTTDRGETIIPRNGEYILQNVRQDVEIFINDIVKNPDPVGNEVIEATSPKVWAENNRLHIQAVATGKGYVYSADGRLLLTCNLNTGEEYSAGLPGGIYFVVIGNERFRVVL